MHSCACVQFASLLLSDTRVLLLLLLLLLLSVFPLFTTSVEEAVGEPTAPFQAQWRTSG